MAYCGYVIKVEKLRKHPNADRLQLLEVFGTETCVGLDVSVGDLGVYFPTDGQLSEEFCTVHDLVRRKDEHGNDAGGFLEPGKRNIKAIRLRGERSDGFYMPIKCLEYTGADLADFTPGTQITIVNGKEICKKYIPRSNKGSNGGTSKGNKARKHKVPFTPLFAEHADTEQLAYNLAAFRPGDEIEITLKMHGTSGRTAYLPVLKGYKRNLLDWILRKPGKPIYEYGYATGTRRTVLEDFDGGFYGSNAFREVHARKFEGKLWAGETVYYELVGYTETGVPIMPSANNKKLNDKEFIKQYGETTDFSYGCDPAGYDKDKWCDEERFSEKPQSDLYVYRMTMTNKDGEVVEYTPDFMRYRCEQIGVKTVPVFSKVFVREDAVLAHNTDGSCLGGKLIKGTSFGEGVREIAEHFYDGPDPIGKTHVREGVVVRIINRPKFCAYKHKNYSFKVLEGLIKSEAEAPDMEEAEADVGTEN